MLSLISSLLLATTASALVPRNQQCCFHLQAKGGPGGNVEQLYDGQNRIGQSGLPEGQYCIGANGGLTDGKGRGCILTPPTTQFQCDVGANPQPGFSVGCHGGLKFNHDSTFYACPTGDHGGFNIYTKPVANQQGCTKITLSADSCKPKCPSKPSQPPPSQCPRDLNGEYARPRLIVPVDSSHPDKSYGTQYNGTISSTVSTIFTFDIPQSYSGKTCDLVFLLPKQSQLQTSAFTISGSGGIDFSMLSSAASEGTTYHSAPSSKQDYGNFDVHPGTATDVKQFKCPAGTSFSVLAKSHGTSLDYFQDYNPCPIGAYVTTH